MSRFSAEKKKGEGVGLLGFLRIVLAATTSCFFGCFRMKDSHSHLLPTPMVSRNKNALSSLFLSDEDDSDRKKVGGWNPLTEEVDIRELKEEAKFLKACGTLFETPVEIRKASCKCIDISAQIEESSKFDSWIPIASIEKLKLEKQPKKSSTPVKISEEWVTGTVSLMGTPSSCTAGHDTERDSISSTQNSDIKNAFTPKDEPDNETQRSTISSGAFATAVWCTSKSVHFNCQSVLATFSSEDSSQHSTQSESTGNSSVSKPSAYPTPLKLTDEMQTPGTVFPGYMNNIAGGKTTKIRSQYVYSVLNPIEYLSQWKEMMEEKPDCYCLRESLKLNDEATLITSQISGALTNDISVGSDRKHELSLSPWVKPDSANQDRNDERFSSASSEKVDCGRTIGDRPTLGVLAAHWNDEEAAHVSPKWCDGNGIPNSTTKYKEDQKVRWHATPFEERLQNALFEDTFIS